MKFEDIRKFAKLVGGDDLVARMDYAHATQDRVDSAINSLCEREVMASTDEQMTAMAIAEGAVRMYAKAMVLIEGTMNIPREEIVEKAVRALRATAKATFAAMDKADAEIAEDDGDVRVPDGMAEMIKAAAKDGGAK